MLKVLRMVILYFLKFLLFSNLFMNSFYSGKISNTLKINCTSQLPNSATLRKKQGFHYRVTSEETGFLLPQGSRPGETQ